MNIGVVRFKKEKVVLVLLTMHNGSAIDYNTGKKTIYHYILQ